MSVLSRPDRAGAATRRPPFRDVLARRARSDATPYDRSVRATIVAALAALAGCAAPEAPRTPRLPESRAELARPEPDPALRGTSQGARAVQPLEQISVRVRRGPDGRLTIVEFLSPGLTESERIELRRAVEAGEMRLEGEAPADRDSWITTLLRPRVR